MESTMDVLQCPVWVAFEDDAGQSYFLNVESGEFKAADPDPDGELKVNLEQIDDKPAEGEEQPKPEKRKMASATACCSCKAPFPVVDHSKPSKEQVEDVQVWMKTAARVQVPYNPEVPQYVEGHEDFNVWYGKYLSDRRNPRDKDRYSAGHTCDPEKDSGWTQADLPGSGSPGFCLFYARGCCGFGHKCSHSVVSAPGYFHHVPTVLDMASLDEAHDIFGRQRFSEHRDDMGGVGSFNSEPWRETLISEPINGCEIHDLGGVDVLEPVRPKTLALQSFDYV
eukprot:Skav205069  [mRNA]  locus=scaffold142:379194:385555:+ [translate_table: standard]